MLSGPYLNSGKEKVFSVLAHRERGGGGWAVEDIIFCEDANIAISGVGDNGGDDDVVYRIDVGL